MAARKRSRLRTSRGENSYPAKRSIYGPPIADLMACLDQASDAAIFYHTFQTLGQHHFLTEGFSNDFAQWVLASLNQPVLAERLASIDIRDYVSIAELRADLRHL